jgi:hypothetical protein
MMLLLEYSPQNIHGLIEHKHDKIPLWPTVTINE